MLADGNSDSLIQLIKSWDVEINPLFYNYLLHNSPYLSVSSFLDLIDLENPIPAGMLTYLLSANQHALKDDSLLTLLTEKEFSFSGWMINLLENSRNETSALEHLDAQLGELCGRRELLRTANIFYTLNSDSTFHDSNYLLGLIDQYSALDSLQRMAAYYYECGGHEMDSLIFSEIILSIPLNQAIKNDFQNYLNLRAGFESYLTSEVPIDSAHSHILTDIARSNHIKCASYAAEILDEKNWYVPEQFDYPSNTSVRQNLPLTPDNTPLPFDISPNPAYTHVLIRFIEPPHESGKIFLCDYSGRLLHEEQIGIGVPSLNINLQSYASGFYLIASVQSQSYAYFRPLIITQQ